MRNKTNNIETRDKISKLIQRFDGIEDNNPPTNAIDNKKTGIIYTSDYIDKDSYPDSIKPLETKYEESIANLDKLQRPGEWVYEIDLEYRYPVNPDYGFNLLNVNDFFTIKKEDQVSQICYDTNIGYRECFSPKSPNPGNYYSLNFADPTNVDSELFIISSSHFSFLDHMQGWNISSQLLNMFADIPGPYYIDIISGPVFNTYYEWTVQIVDASGNVVGNNASHKEGANLFCVQNKFSLFISKGDYPTLYISIGDIMSSYDFNTCGYAFPSDIWTITDIQSSFVNPDNVGNPGYWIVTIENSNGDRPYFGDEFRTCKGNTCFNHTSNLAIYNNDVRGYIKSVEEIVDVCNNPIGLIDINWSVPSEWQIWIEQYLNFGVQYASLPNQCCPVCEPYFIGTLGVLATYVKTFKPKDLCCFNVKSTMGKPWWTQFGWFCDSEHNCCDTNFTECADQILSLSPNFLIYESTIQSGIVEYSQLGDTSTLCNIYDYAMTIPLAQDRWQFLSILIQNGLVIVCASEFTYFYSMQAYIAAMQNQP